MANQISMELHKIRQKCPLYETHGKSVCILSSLLFQVWVQWPKLYFPGSLYNCSKFPQYNTVVWRMPVTRGIKHKCCCVRTVISLSNIGFTWCIETNLFSKIYGKLMANDFLMTPYCVIYSKKKKKVNLGFFMNSSYLVCVKVLILMFLSNTYIFIISCIVTDF